MLPYWQGEFGNPSSLHRFGTRAATAQDEARASVVGFINAKPGEIVFTSSGTESNNLAVLGVAKANRKRGRHIITTEIEHPSIQNCCRALERDGYLMTYLPVNNNGLIKLAEFKKALRPETILATVHLANSEIGVIQDIANLSKLARANNTYFHTDACQATAYLRLDVRKLGVDLLSFNGSKMYGPKGIAALYVREGVEIFPIFYGGGQQGSLRSGTENLPGIVGLAKACEIAARRRTADSRRVATLRDQLQKSLEAAGCTINVKTAPRLPNHLSVVVPTDRADVVAALDRFGVAASSGSACSERSLVESHVLTAIGLTSDQAHKTTRISLGRLTTKADCQKVIAAVEKIMR